MGQHRHGDNVSVRSGSSGSSRSSRGSSYYCSTTDSYSSSFKGAVIRNPQKHENLAVRLAVHCLQGPFANKRYPSHEHGRHKKHGYHGSSSSSSSSSRSSSSHHRSSGSSNFSPQPVWGEPMRMATGQRPPPPPPPPPPGRQFNSGSGAFGNGQGFVQLNGQVPAVSTDPIWGNGRRQGFRG